MEDTIHVSLFLRDNNPMSAEAAKTLARKIPQWKFFEFEKTPAGCPIPEEGEVWDPVIGAGPSRPYMVPKGVTVADGVLVMMRLYYELPFEFSGITLVELQKIHGLTKGGRIQRLATKTKRDNGSTVYDVDGNLMKIDETVMRGNKVSDVTRPPGHVNETNFLKPGGSDKKLWFNRLFNGADTPLAVEGAAFAQHWLTQYGYDIRKQNKRLGMDVRRIDETKKKRYEQLYSEELARRGRRIQSGPPHANSASGLKLRLSQKSESEPPKAPTVLMESNEESNLEECEESEDDMPITRKPRKLIPRSEVSAKVGNVLADSFEVPSGDKNNKESNEEVASILPGTAVEPPTEKSPKTLENAAPTSPDNITLAPAETASERAARLRREVAEKSKALEDLQKLQAEAAEQAIAEEKAKSEKAAEERAAANKAAAEDAVAKEAAAELARASAESNKKAANKTLKYSVEIIKFAISTYLSQRKAEAADRTLVGKLDEELVQYFGGALKVTAGESQKRKLQEEESENKRQAKVARK
ncbi:hypothetical protein V496_08738 [Pseudogymnoascus sp. VKM F-4515 (FW-2607)]|nr:hypothetical protein V496_08738 [Pseudogymnoascus sp. VKM F-4515 (FW-2607)]